MLLQQHLPFTVLKLLRTSSAYTPPFDVATALTVYGIETDTEFICIKVGPACALQQHLPFTVLKLARLFALADSTYGSVATALTVYGIETKTSMHLVCEIIGCNSTYRLRY